MKDTLTIKEVCTITKVSEQTIYRRMKLSRFPKPKKVKSNLTRGRGTINKWDRGEVMGWLLKGNDPKWMKLSVKDIKAACAKVDKELAKKLELGLMASFEKERLRLDDSARLAEGENDLIDFDSEEQSNKSYFIVQAIIGALLAGVAVLLFTK